MLVNPSEIGESWARWEELAKKVSWFFEVNDTENIVDIYLKFVIWYEFFFAQFIKVTELDVSIILDTSRNSIFFDRYFFLTTFVLELSAHH